MSGNDSKAPEVLKKAREGRSPAYPFIGLQEALRRAEQFRRTEGKHLVPLTSAYKAWRVSEKTAAARQTAAALGHFGLFTFSGSGEGRQARLTDLALKILLDTREVSPERDELTQQAALSPAIHKELRQKWPDDLPSIATMETYLVRDRGFSRAGALLLINEYKDTLAFAKVSKSANMPNANVGQSEIVDQEPEIEIGDLVQAEVDGALAFEEPKRVRAFQEHEGRQWVFVEGHEAGILMEQTILIEKGAGEETKLPPTPPKLPLKPAAGIRPPILLGVRREVFALDEGDVTLTFPEKMSSGSYEDLEAYLKIFLRKAKRQVDVSKAAAIESGDPDDITMA
jgi:hypothetical protein